MNLNLWKRFYHDLDRLEATRSPLIRESIRFVTRVNQIVQKVPNWIERVILVFGLSLGNELVRRQRAVKITKHRGLSPRQRFNDLVGGDAVLAKVLNH